MSHAGLRRCCAAPATPPLWQTTLSSSVLSSLPLRKPSQTLPPFFFLQCVVQSINAGSPMRDCGGASPLWRHRPFGRPRPKDQLDRGILHNCLMRLNLHVNILRTLAPVQYKGRSFGWRFWIPNVMCAPPFCAVSVTSSFYACSPCAPNTKYSWSLGSVLRARFKNKEEMQQQAKRQLWII